MNDFETMILNNLKFSYSSANTFLTCALSFKNSYITIEDRMGNAFSDFGSFCHKILEKYLKGELEIWDLEDYYRNHYRENMKSSFPVYPSNMAEKYFQDGLTFFENFEFDKSEWDILGIEEKLETAFKDIKLVIVPDLVVKNKKSDIVYLYDYKTSNMIKNGKVDKTKLEDYKKQMYLYVYFLWYIKQIEVSKIRIIAIRNNQTIEFDYDPVAGNEVLEWFMNTIEKIKMETEWKGNTKNKYFCIELCSSRFSCPFVNGTGK